jgi:hypothetical protein
MSDDPLNRSYDHSLIELAHLEGDTSVEAALRRVAIYDGQTDFFQGLSEIAKSQGKTQTADTLKSLADECWGKCIEATADLDKSQTPTDEQGNP